MKIDPELDQAVKAHARAFASGDMRVAEASVAERGRESYRAAVEASETARPFAKFEILACAKIGNQYVVKVRWTGARRAIVLQNRWSRESGAWQIVEVEDLTSKASPWSDVPRWTERSASGSGNG